MHAEPVAEPSNILWENLEVSHKKRVLKRVFVTLITIILMIGSIALIYYLKTIEDDIPTDRSCRDRNIKGDNTLEYAIANYKDEED